MELEQRITIRLLDREHADPRALHAQLSGQCGHAACSLLNGQRRYQYSRQGRQLLDDEPRSGRPPIDLLKIQILSSLEK
jgi:hypothetical protein